MKPVVLGVDASTTAVKAIAFDVDGAIVAEGRAPIALSSPEPGAWEQDASEWWSATCAAVRAVVAALGGRRIEGISIANQRETFVFTDAEGEPLRPALTWMDARCTAEVARAVAALGDDCLHRVSGKPPSPTPSVYKAMFVLGRDAGLAEKRPFLLDVHAFLVRRLTGHFRTSVASADPTGLVDLGTAAWSPRLCDLLPIAADRLPELFAVGAAMGGVDVRGARETGLALGTPVFAGAGDGQAASLGAGVTAPGSAYLNVGTAIVSGVPSPTPRIDRAFRTLFAASGGFLLETDLLGGTFSFNWLAETFFSGEDRSSVLARLAAESRSLPPGAGGLMFLPYLGGVMTPYWDDAARGALVGLRGEHGPAHVYRAIAEGLALEQRVATTAVEAAVGPLPEIVVLGGPMGDDAFCQLFADAMNKRLVRASTVEATALGAAMLAATGAAFHPTIAAAAAAMSSRGASFSPGEASLAYSTRFEAYRAMYPALAAVMRQL
jgi:xylulokinase